MGASSVAAYRRDAENLLCQIFQGCKNAAVSDASIEILWTTSEVSNQAYRASIRLFVILRRIEGYREEIGHNDLADIEAARELQNSEVEGGAACSENTTDNLLDAIDAYGSRKMSDLQIEANNEMADKLREYTIAQGHKADYSDDYNEMSSSEASDFSQPIVSEERDVTDEPAEGTNKR